LCVILEILKTAGVQNVKISIHRHVREQVNPTHLDECSAQPPPLWGVDLNILPGCDWPWFFTQKYLRMKAVTANQPAGSKAKRER
jgi:hypothetical protein